MTIRTLLNTVALVALGGLSLTASAANATEPFVSPAQPPIVPQQPQQPPTRSMNIPIPPALASLRIPLSDTPPTKDILPIAQWLFPSKTIRILMPNSMYTQEFSSERINIRLEPTIDHKFLVITKIFPG